jgi:hypothetical protein
MKSKELKKLKKLLISNALVIFVIFVIFVILVIFMLSNNKEKFNIGAQSNPSCDNQKNNAKKMCSKIKTENDKRMCTNAKNALRNCRELQNTPKSSIPSILRVPGTNTNNSNKGDSVIGAVPVPLTESTSLGSQSVTESTTNENEKENANPTLLNMEGLPLCGTGDRNGFVYTNTLRWPNCYFKDGGEAAQAATIKDQRNGRSELQNALDYCEDPNGHSVAKEFQTLGKCFEHSRSLVDAIISRGS